MTEPQRSLDRTVPADQSDAVNPEQARETAGVVREIGGPKGPEPTRYGDWEKKGRCIDF
ncbi:MAG: DUF1674 domain-containing protein [Nevskiales bacterium]